MPMTTIAHPHAVGCKDARSSVSRRIRIASVLGTLAVALCAAAGSAPVAAQSAEGGVQACPRGYALIDLRPAYCVSSSGDVVEPATKTKAASLGGCRQGYDRLEGLCHSPETGDVELAETASRAQASR
jgi:hypothetical protein